MSTVGRTRKHNCEAETNLVRLGVEWNPDGSKTLIQKWGCRKCHNTWTTIYDPEKVERERLAENRRMVAEAAAQITAERASCELF